MILPAGSNRDRKWHHNVCGGGSSDVGTTEPVWWTSEPPSTSGYSFNDVTAYETKPLKRSLPGSICTLMSFLSAFPGRILQTLTMFSDLFVSSFTEGPFHNEDGGFWGHRGLSVTTSTVRLNDCGSTERGLHVLSEN